MKTRIFTLYLADGTSTTMSHIGEPNRVSSAVADILSRKYVVDSSGDFINCINIVKISLKEEKED